MPLTKKEKVGAVDDIVTMLTDVPTVYLTNYQGLDVSQATELRNRFREQGVGFKVVKNTLLKLAMDRIGGFDELYEYLEGPTAIAYSIEPAAPGRVMKKFASDNKHDLPALKAAYVDGAIYHSDALDVLAALRSKDEIIGEIVSLLRAPLANIAGALTAQGSNLVSIVKVIQERAES